MLHYAAAYHVQIDVDQASDKMLAGLNGRRMVAVLPKCTFAAFSPVKLLGRLPCNKLHTLPYRICCSIHCQQVDMIGCDRVIENVQPVALPGLEQPLKPALSVQSELEKELLLMAPMGNVPDLARNVMTVCSWHAASSLKRPSSTLNVHSKPKYRPNNNGISFCFNGIGWSDPRKLKSCPIAVPLPVTVVDLSGEGAHGPFAGPREPWRLSLNQEAKNSVTAAIYVGRQRRD